MRIYKNDVEQGGGQASSRSLSAGTLFRVGAWSAGGSGWDGWLDEVAVYNTALGPAAIRSHFDAGMASGTLQGPREFPPRHFGPF